MDWYIVVDSFFGKYHLFCTSMRISSYHTDNNMESNAQLEFVFGVSH